MRSEEGRERVAGLVAGAGGDYVVDGVMQFFRGALDTLKIIAERARDGLLDDAGFLCHTDFRGCFARNLPSCHFGR